MRIFDDGYTYVYSFPIVPLSCFLRFLNSYSGLVLTAHIIERYVDPKHTTPLHKLGSISGRAQCLRQSEAHATILPNVTFWKLLSRARGGLDGYPSLAT
jgi:hypothetical protein